MAARTIRRMSSMVQSQSSPFSKAVISALRKIYPESLADKSFDNTGVMLEAPHNPEKKLRNSVLLTIDLTKAVAEEAIQKKCGVIVAYLYVHQPCWAWIAIDEDPIIFRGLKSLTFGNTQQSSLLQLAAEGISVYSPHTAVDAATGGNADWLADIVTAELARDSGIPEGYRPAKRLGSSATYGLFSFASSQQLNRSGEVGQNMWELGASEHERKVIVPNNDDDSKAGMGRIVTFGESKRLSDILWKITSYLGQPPNFTVAMPQVLQEIPLSRRIRTVGICAGSGGSLLGDLDVDLLLTGELSHHEALAATENEKVVICLGHSNSERGYLDAVMKGKLLEALKTESSIEGGEVSVEVSETDRDPFLSLVRNIKD